MSSGPVCRTCGAAVQPDWRICPHCEAPLRPRPEVVTLPDVLPADDEVPAPDDEPGRAAHRDARRDQRPIGFGLMLLGLIGFGVAVLLVLSEAVETPTAAQWLLMGGGPILVTVIGIAVTAAGRPSHSTAAQALAGGCMVGAMSVLLVVAMILFAIMDCINSCNRGLGK